MNTTRKLQVLLRGSVCVPLLIGIAGAQAAQTDLASEPLITPGTSSVKPNMYFVLDNSGSMDWDYLPDWVNDSSLCKDNSGRVYGQGGLTCYSGSGQRGMPPFHAAGFNSIFYDPKTTYTTPKNYDGSNKTSYTGATAVPWDGYYIQSSNTLTLTTSYPDTEWCTDSSYVDCLRNDNYILPGIVDGKSYTTQHDTTASGSKSFASGTVASPTVTARSVGPYYYVIVPGEYCTTKKLTDCAAQTGPSLARDYPAKLRWCNNSALKDIDDASTTTIVEGCQALKNATYKYPRYPTIILSGSQAAGAQIHIKITSVTDDSTFTINQLTAFDGKTLLPYSILCKKDYASCNTNGGTSARRNNIRDAIVTAINAGSSGFTAVADSDHTGDLIITASTGTTYNGKTLRMTSTAFGGSQYSVGSGNLQFELGGDFDGYYGTNDYDNGNFDTSGSTGSSIVAVPGSFKRVDIVSGQTYGNIVVDGTTIVDRSSRSDCAAPPNCTYAEELANYANWFSWYRSRMQMMKSSVSLAFQGIDDQYRVGYFTLNSPSMATTASNGLNIDDFTTTQKQKWYTKLFAADPGSGTPLREALSRAGRLFAGETTSVLAYATDPMQYSCQKNYTILSTDGYWNGNAGLQLGGATSIGNHDGSLPRPELDGRNDSGTLADVAAYYYNTDLRTTNCTGSLGGDVCADNVPTTTNDLKQTQHMVTFTIGLGIDGVMQYRSNYKQTAGAGDLPDDYTAVAAGTAPSPSTGVCSWQTIGSCNWPQPGADKQENIDDLWHAAVNGHGTYYSARSPSELYSGLTDALSAISASTGGAAAATTSNPNITTGDNFVFSSNYMTVEWTGELVSQNIDVATGDILPAVNWSAQVQLDSKASATRNIYTFSASSPSLLKPFDWASLNYASPNTCNPPADERGCFSSTYIDSTLAQFCASGLACLSATDKVSASGEQLVLYLRGDRTHESAAPPWYRPRSHLLGDIVSAEAVYAGRYLFDYGGTYPEKNTARTDPSVYVAANDGMLHALNAANGVERWAYIPNMLLPKLHKLANVSYDTNHIFLVDGTPTVGDIQVGANWNTILVGGLAGGGPGYYALDISNQTLPKAKWEFHKKAGCTVATAPRYSSSGGVTEDCDLGYSYGNPVIGKIGGTWVVLVTSGYNNHLNGGTGVGYLYILNADTGAIINKIATGVGDTITPSGLSRINAWADDAMHDNTIDYAYGGDLLGNLWRFDLVAGTKILLKNFGATKPITAKPELGLVVTNSGQEKRVIFVPTGRLLGLTDLGNTDQQSFYGIWDKTTGAPPTTIVNQAVTSGGTGREGTTCDSVFEDDANLGWQMNFPDAGERGNTDPTLAFGTLVFSTNKPSAADACNPSGFESWVYNIDYLCGGVVKVPGDKSNTHVATHYSGASTRPNVVVLPSGVVKSITRTSGQQLTNNVEEVRIGASGGGVRRVSWRELLD
jgi:type IV pilus assembly protein PilY1